MSKRITFQFLIILAILFRVNNSANVLCMFTSPVKNQLIVFMSVANTLIERGHNVTIVTILQIPQHSMSKRPFRHIFLESPPETIRTLNDYMMEISNGFISKLRIMRNIYLTAHLFTEAQKKALERERFQNFFKENNHFDLMVLGYFHNDFMLGVAARYKCPVAVVSLGAPYGSVNRMIGNPAETTYVQIPFFGKSQPMSFTERAKNFLWTGVEPLVQLYEDFVMDNIYSFPLFGLLRLNHSANILCMFTLNVQPNLVVFMAIANTLIENGHNVTIVTSIPIPQHVYPKRKFHHIYLESSIEKIHELKDMSKKMLNESLAKTTMSFNFLKINSYQIYMQRDAIRSDRFQEFFQDDGNSFDLMVLGFYYNDFIVGVAARYKCPIAVVSLCAPFGTLTRWIGNPVTTSYVQIPFMGISQPMNFVERFQNFLLDAAEPFVHMYTEYVMDSIYRTLFTDESYPSYSEMVLNISLVLFNRHFSELPIRPLVPALVEIGGIQVQDESDSLPQNIRKFIDESKNGTILFRVGSLARSTQLNPDQLRIFFNILSKLVDWRVVWEWEHLYEPPDEFPNILFYTSIAPNAFLPLPKLKLYITDGRPLAIQEAIYHGVPMLGVPIFGEEPYTVAEMTNHGFGVSIEINNLTEELFNESLVKVLGDPFFAQKLKFSSQLLRDRPNSPRETAAFWLEYVIRYRGALHMQSPLVHMNFIQRWNIDVIVALIAILWIFVKLACVAGLVGRVIVDWRLERRKARNKLKQL